MKDITETQYFEIMCDKYHPCNCLDIYYIIIFICYIIFGICFLYLSYILIKGGDE